MYKIFPDLENYKIDFSWGGSLAITVNRLPHFGTLMNGRILYAHGYSGHGLGFSTLAGKLIAEKITGFADRFNYLIGFNWDIDRILSIHTEAGFGGSRTNVISTFTYRFYLKSSISIIV